MGSTNAMMRLGSPKRSSDSIARGKAASLDAVVNAISHGSLTKLQNRAIGMRAISATGSRTSSTNTISAP